MIVTAAIVEKNGKVLLARRMRHDDLAGKWEFPGGKLEIGETPEECLRRELKEEFGIESRVMNFVASSTFCYPHIEIKLLAYRVEHISGEFEILRHEELSWVAPKDLLTYDLSEADIPIAWAIQDLS